MSQTIVPQPTTPPQLAPDLARGDTLPAPKQRRCKGCGGRWLPGHACMTPATTPTTPTHWHRHDLGTRLYEEAPGPEGEWVWRATHACGCVLVQCCRSKEVMLQERAAALETVCPSCRFRARRDALDVECNRG